MDSSELVDRLASLPGIDGVPRAELAWLAERGRVETHDPGVIMAPGEDVDHLLVVLSGRVVVRVDRGVGPRRVIEWHPGEVTGRLPFSRMGQVQNDVFVDIPTELLAVHRDHFSDMVHECQAFTAHAVHTMIDRARRFNTSALQDEKMISLGRVAAGLAHELNNPASAAMRGSKLLRSALSEAEKASRTLARAGLTEESVQALEELLAGWIEAPSGSSFELEDDIAEWMRARGLDDDCGAALAELSVTPDRLDEITRLVPENTLGAVFHWIAAGAETRLTSLDIEGALIRIHDLVAAVKRFTSMDKVEGPGAVDVEVGLRDTIGILMPGVVAKNATITLSTPSGVPPVRAVANDLNQVWMKVIENAVHAIAPSGRIEVSLAQEHDRVVVRVLDDGPGIAPDLLPRVFDPFFTTKAPGEGMGLGLEIARQLLRRYGGEITAESETGRTEFRVSLPVEAG